jgi:hypothetical protein
VRVYWTAALALTLLCGLAQPPAYKNPLSPDQVEALRVSDIWYEKPQLVEVNSKYAAFLFEAMRSRLIERLGDKFAPSNGNAVLIVRLEKLAIEGAPSLPKKVHANIKGKVLLKPNFSADYPGANETVHDNVYRNTVGGTWPNLARSLADRLVNQILWKNP